MFPFLGGLGLGTNAVSPTGVTTAMPGLPSGQAAAVPWATHILPDLGPVGASAETWRILFLARQLFQVSVQACLLLEATALPGPLYGVGWGG